MTLVRVETADDLVVVRRVAEFASRGCRSPHRWTITDESLTLDCPDCDLFVRARRGPAPPVDAKAKD